MSKILRFSAVAAATMVLAACGGNTDGTETADETNVEGAADETMQAAEGAGDAMNPIEEGANEVGDTAVAVDDAMDKAEAAADRTAEEAQ